jgi:hypothetical protein
MTLFGHRKRALFRCCFGVRNAGIATSTSANSRPRCITRTLASPAAWSGARVSFQLLASSGYRGSKMTDDTIARTSNGCSHPPSRRGFDTGVEWCNVCHAVMDELGNWVAVGPGPAPITRSIAQDILSD